MTQKIRLKVEEKRRPRVQADESLIKAKQTRAVEQARIQRLKMETRADDPTAVAKLADERVRSELVLSDPGLDLEKLQAAIVDAEAALIEACRTAHSVSLGPVVGALYSRAMAFATAKLESMFESYEVPNLVGKLKLLAPITAISSNLSGLNPSALTGQEYATQILALLDRIDDFKAQLDAAGAV